MRATEDWLRVGPATVGLLVVNVAVFVAVSVRPGLLRTLGLSSDAGEIAERPWTLATVAFTSEHPLHLVAAVAVVFFVGGALERRSGPAHVLAIYLLAGVVGSATILAVTGTGAPETWVGASAAFLGLVAALAVLPADAAMQHLQLPKVLVAILVVNAASPFLGFAWGSASAHVAGLAVGALYGWALRGRVPEPVRSGVAPP